MFIACASQQQKTKNRGHQVHQNTSSIARAIKKTLTIKTARPLASTRYIAHASELNWHWLRCISQRLHQKLIRICFVYSCNLKKSRSKCVMYNALLLQDSPNALQAMVKCKTLSLLASGGAFTPPSSLITAAQTNDATPRR